MVEPDKSAEDGTHLGRNFRTSWFGEFVGDTSAVLDDLEQIKAYAFEAFDRLDEDGNGYLDRDELVDALTNDRVSTREKAFISFLLCNQSDIAESFDENEPANKDKISRADLENYFHMIMSML